jgi:hypothetical protein
MPRNWLRFPMSSQDQLRITGPIRVLEGGPAFPDWLRLECTYDPSQGAPQLTPLFPGKISFLADSQAPGVLPKPTDVFTWTDQQYQSWRTVGTLIVELDETAVADEIAQQPGTPDLIPRVAWYWPVRITKEFLFDSMRAGNKLRKTPVQRPTGGSVPISASNWDGHAVSGFLNSTHKVEVGPNPDPAKRLDPTQDQAVLFNMPVWEMTAGGDLGLWMAIAAGTTLDDMHRTALPSIQGTTPLLDPAHPANALLNTRQTLIALQLQLIGAGSAAEVLAAEALAAWPAKSRYFTIFFSIPGNPYNITFSDPARTPKQPAYFSGLLPHEEIEVKDDDGTVLQKRRLPTNGVVTIAQSPKTPAPPPLTVDITLSPGTLKITDTDGSRLAGGVRFDFGTLTDRAWVSLQFPGPTSASAAALEGYRKKLAKLTLPLSRLPKTKNIIKEALEEYERTIRPVAWLPADLVFRGTRMPWKGSPNNPVPVSEADQIALFQGLQRISFNNQAPIPPLPIRPSEAMILWLLEGRIALLDQNLLSPGAPTVPKNFGDVFGVNDPLAQPFSEADLVAAADADLIAVIRTLLLWNFWGMDILSRVHYDPAAQDTLLTWSATVAATAADHNAKMASGLQAIRNAGIVPPNEAKINSTIVVNTLAGRRHFHLTADYLPTMIWLQYAEYLRRLTLFTDPAATGAHPAMPAAARNFPAFGYIAFNARAGVPRAAQYWAWCDAILFGPHDPWVKTHEDALRTWRLGDREPPELANTPRGGLRRSTWARVNGLHFAALVRSYGAVFPSVLNP